jgi:GxxExxY protein
MNKAISGNKKVVSMLYSEITDKIISAFYKVYNTLGFGFLEKVYENALALELRNAGCSVVQQQKIAVLYSGVVVGDYYADLIVDNLVIVELKASDSLCEEHEAQLLNYLKTTSIEVGLLLNFGKKPEFKRKVFSNKNK